MKANTLKHIKKLTSFTQKFHQHNTTFNKNVPINNLNNPFHLFFISKTKNFYSTQTQSNINETMKSEKKRGTLVIFGGTGFVGKHIVQELAPNFDKVRIATRKPKEITEKFISQNPSLNNVKAYMCNIKEESHVDHIMHGGVDTVIQSCDLKVESDDTMFDIMVQGPKFIARCSHLYNVKRFINIGCLGSEIEGPSKYLDWKARTEDMIYAAYPNATFLRPSIMFGNGNWFFENWMKPASVIPVQNPKIQPVYVRDVAKAVLKCIENEDTIGKVFELGGPKVYTMKDALKMFEKTTVLPLPYSIVHAMVWMREFLPPVLSPITCDIVRGVYNELTVNQERDPHLPSETFEYLGIKPQSLEEYLGLLDEGNEEVINEMENEFINKKGTKGVQLQ